MTGQDAYLFERSFARVISAFRLKLKPGEREELTQTYFRVLEDWPLDDVLAAGKICIATHRTFPKPADWLHIIATTAPPIAPATVRQMSTGELDEFAAAEQLRWSDQPCLCSECGRAGIDDQPVRFVPTLAGDDEERAFNPRRNLVQVVGHWAHGDELRRFYDARDRFFALAVRHPLALQLVTREPGEEG